MNRHLIPAEVVRFHLEMRARAQGRANGDSDTEIEQAAEAVLQFADALVEVYNLGVVGGLDPLEASTAIGDIVFRAETDRS